MQLSPPRLQAHSRSIHGRRGRLLRTIHLFRHFIARTQEIVSSVKYILSLIATVDERRGLIKVFPVLSEVECEMRFGGKELPGLAAAYGTQSWRQSRCRHAKIPASRSWWTRMVVEAVHASTTTESLWCTPLQSVQGCVMHNSR